MAQAALTTPLVGPLSYRDLCAQTVDVESTIRWCQSLKLLRSNLMCSCGRRMNLVEREKAGKEGVLWRWLVCAQYYIDHPAVIGGPNVEVEIDESKFGKRKYNRGRTVDGHWVYGGVERMTGECFLVEVQQRDAATLLPIVQNFVRPGSIVYSDEWAAYNQLAATAACQHQTVNHSIHFVDPQTGAHTQGIEGLWSACKRMMREEHAGRNADLFTTYLQEYMWRRRFGGPTTFCNIVKHIAEQYPL